MDDIDHYQEHADEVLWRANRQKSLRDIPSEEAIGECLNCGELVEPGRRWCNADYRDDWERTIR